MIIVTYYLIFSIVVLAMMLYWAWNESQTITIGMLVGAAILATVPPFNILICLFLLIDLLIHSSRVFNIPLIKGRYE
jgi:hypothetical protein